MYVHSSGTLSRCTSCVHGLATGLVYESSYMEVEGDKILTLKVDDDRGND